MGRKTLLSEWEEMGSVYVYSPKSVNDLVIARFFFASSCCAHKRTPAYYTRRRRYTPMVATDGAEVPRPRLLETSPVVRHNHDLPYLLRAALLDDPAKVSDGVRVRPLYLYREPVAPGEAAQRRHGDPLVLHDV